jgi:hypothetical protein
MAGVQVDAWQGGGVKAHRGLCVERRQRSQAPPGRRKTRDLRYTTLEFETAHGSVAKLPALLLEGEQVASHAVVVRPLLDRVGPLES